MDSIQDSVRFGSLNSESTQPAFQTRFCIRKVGLSCCECQVRLSRAIKATESIKKKRILCSVLKLCCKNMNLYTVISGHGEAWHESVFMFFKTSIYLFYICTVYRFIPLVL